MELPLSSESVLKDHEKSVPSLNSFLRSPRIFLLTLKKLVAQESPFFSLLPNSSRDLLMLSSVMANRGRVWFRWDEEEVTAVEALGMLFSATTHMPVKSLEVIMS